MVRADQAFATGQTFAEEVQIQRRGGACFWASLQGAAVKPGSPTEGVIWLIADVSTQRQHREQLSWSATHDVLTDLVNRREFEARLQVQLHDRRRHEMASALFIDLDDFKAVNDSAGHAAGDAMLQQVAALLSSASARATRWRAWAATSSRCCCAVATGRRPRRSPSRSAAASPRSGCPGRVRPCGSGASIGVVEIEDSLGDIKAVLAAADAACYAASGPGATACEATSRAAWRCIEGRPEPQGRMRPRPTRRRRPAP